jgi:hypothetical protein
VLLKDGHPNDPLSHQKVGQLGQVGLNRVGGHPDRKIQSFQIAMLTCVDLGCPSEPAAEWAGTFWSHRAIGHTSEIGAF